MNNLHELYKISEELITPLQASVVFLSGKHLYDAMRAADELAALNARVEELEKKARLFVNSLPVDEIELARDVFGNTNTRLILVARSELEAALKGAE